jgi:hypothetical protein
MVTQDIRLLQQFLSIMHFWFTLGGIYSFTSLCTSTTIYHTYDMRPRLSCNLIFPAVPAPLHCTNPTLSLSHW